MFKLLACTINIYIPKYIPWLKKQKLYPNLWDRQWWFVIQQWLLIHQPNDCRHNEAQQARLLTSDKQATLELIHGDIKNNREVFDSTLDLMACCAKLLWGLLETRAVSLAALTMLASAIKAARCQPKGERPDETQHAASNTSHSSTNVWSSWCRTARSVQYQFWIQLFSALLV